MTTTDNNRKKEEEEEEEENENEERIFFWTDEHKEQMKLHTNAKRSARHAQHRHMKYPSPSPLPFLLNALYYMLLSLPHAVLLTHRNTTRGDNNIATHPPYERGANGVGVVTGNSKILNVVP